MTVNKRDEGARGCRREGCSFHRLDRSKVNRLNEEIAKTGVAQPSISDVIMVFNGPLRECYLVLLQQVHHHSAATPRVGHLVKLSDRRSAPYRGGELWLRTPAYYRRIESADSKPTDPHDGLLTKDATPWIRQAIASRAESIENLNATMTFSAPQEPWVYCTSISPTRGAEMEKLKARFPAYDAMTAIGDPDAFAVRLGIDFAFSVQESTHVELGPFEKLAYHQSSYTVSLWEGKHRVDKVVRVYHGPVVYEDRSGVLEFAEDSVDPSMVPKGWFTKKKKFSAEREYRFAVSTLGKPRNDTFKLRISDELRGLTTKA